MTRTTAFALAAAVALWVAACAPGEISGSESDVGTDVFNILGEGSCPDAEGTGCVTIDTPDDSLPPEEGGCWVTGIGTFGKGDSRDSFGGNAMTMRDGSVRGEWQHVDHFDVTGAQRNGQNLFHGQVEYIHCEKYPTLSGPEVPVAEPNYATWGGHGRYNGVDGYSFEVEAFDHGEGGIFLDRYIIKVRDPSGAIVLEADGAATNGINNGTRDTSCRDDDAITTAELDWVKEMGCLSGGNLQIHPPNAGHPY
jgi:hypothetical protein